MTVGELLDELSDVPREMPVTLDGHEAEAEWRVVREPGDEPGVIRIVGVVLS